LRSGLGDEPVALPVSEIRALSANLHSASRVVSASEADAPRSPGPDEPPAPYRHALFLQERSIPDARLSPEALAAATQRAVRWQSSSGAEEATFRYRLSAAGLDWYGFLGLLAEREREQLPATAAEGAYDWYRVLEEIRVGAYADVSLHPVRWKNPDGSEGTEPPFASFLRPFLQCGVGRLRRGLAQLEAKLNGAAPLLKTSAEVRFMLDLTEILTKKFSSTLILELNAARLRGLLPGNTPYQRFRYFSEQYFTPVKVLELLAEYPVLARLLALAVERWADAVLEFLARLAADRERLGLLLGASGAPEAPHLLGTLRWVQVGVSDLHRQGRSVVIAEDEQGHRIVYKPTSLAVDAQMQCLVHAVNGFGLRYPLRTAQVIDCGEYGWLQFIATLGCESIDELRRFYWRQGCWIALLHLVRGADFHYENLIACGEYPVLVDNEALFHQDPWGKAAGETAYQDASTAMMQSVLRQGLLPFVQRLTREGEGVDSSGLSGAGGQIARSTVRRWAEPGTDKMHVVEADMVTQEALNRPSLQGKPVDATDFLADIVQGFRETYDLLAARRDELRLVLDGFADTTVRHLIRPTRIYTVFLREGHHPNDLRDGLEREELLDRLWALASESPQLLRAIPFEHEDLRTGDIPVFFSRPDSTDLWSSGGERIEDFFAEPSLRAAYRELDRMSEEERERQVLLIRLALSEARSRGLGSVSYGRDSEASSAGEVRPLAWASGLHDAAVHVGETLKRRALVGERGVCWISLDPFGDGRSEGATLRNIAIAREDLYHGAAGIALFLAYLGEVASDGGSTELARGTVRAMLEVMAVTGPASNQALGAYLGRASYSYALQHLAALWSESGLLDEALADLPNIEALISEDREFDILAGSAGCAIVMLQLHAATGEPAALRIARACGDHLLRSAQSFRSGLGWKGSSFASPVAGLAHGAAGIAWALSELASTTGDERYHQTALKALAFERNLLSSSDGEAFHTRVSWCNGLPSVAFARILTSVSMDDPLFAGEIVVGANRILETGAPADSCLCHGVLGNAEILEACGRYCDIEEWRRTARTWAASTARSVEGLERDLLLPLHGRFAGLLCGLSGIGWELLRFAHWGKIPSVLMLEPPRRRTSGKMT
jgi:type 2 lantibiotic biosynthesis protein LanM